MGSHSLLQRIFPIQGSNQSLLHWRQILYHLSHQGSQHREKTTNKYPANLFWVHRGSDIQFSRSVMSNSLQPHQLQHLFLLTQGQALQSFPTQSFRNPLPIYSKFMPQWSLFVISDKIDPFFNDERDYQNLQSQQHCIMQFCILCKFPNELVSQWERLLVRGDTEYRMSNYLQLENSRGQECSSIGKLCNCNWHSASIVSLSRKIWYKGFRQFKKI